MALDFVNGPSKPKATETKETPVVKSTGGLDFVNGPQKKQEVKKPADVMTGASYIPGKEPKKSSVYTPTVKLTEVETQPVTPVDQEAVKSAINIAKNIPKDQPIDKGTKDAVNNTLSKMASAVDKSFIGLASKPFSAVLNVGNEIVKGLASGFQQEARDVVNNIKFATKFALDKTADIRSSNAQKQLDQYNKIVDDNIKRKAEGKMIRIDPYAGNVGQTEKFNTVEDLQANTGILKVMNTPAGKEVIKFVGENTSNIPIKLYSGAKAKITGDDYDTVLSNIIKSAEDPNAGVVTKFLYNLQNTGVQTAIGALGTLAVGAITKNPKLAESVGIAYWSAVSANGQLKEKGRIEDIGSVAIDVLGDRMLGDNIGKLMGSKTGFVNAMLRSGNVEGSTEVLQAIMQYGNEYTQAASQSDREKIVKKLGNYLKDPKNGALMEYLVGAVAGAGTTAVARIGGVDGGETEIPQEKINVIVEDLKLKNPEITTAPVEKPIEETPSKTVVTEEVPSKTEVKESVPQPSETVEQNIGEIKNIPEKDLTLEVVSKEQPVPEIKSINDFMEPTKAQEIAKNYDLKPVQVEVSPDEYYSISPESIDLMKKDGLTLKEGKTLPLISESAISKYNLPENIINRISEIRSSLKDTSKWVLNKTKTGYRITTGIGAYEDVTPKKVKITKEEKAEAPLIDQKKIKTLYETSPELQANPKLVVDADKNLVFKSDKQTIKINPEALKLNKENLKEGDVVKIDPALLDGKGELRVMEKTPTGKNVYANESATGEFLPKEEVNREAAKIKVETINRVHLPELIKLSKDFAGIVPKVKDLGTGKGGYFRKDAPKEIVINTNLFEAGREEELAAVLSHELGHAVDMLPPSAGKKQNLLGKIYNLNVYMKNTIGKTIATNNTIKKELSELSKWWTPYNDAEVSKKYKTYRNSAKELYAQYISVLFSAPQEAMNRAPQFSTLFFENLDKKPSFRRTYFEIQDAINNTNMVSVRRGRAEDMFKKGSMKASELEAIRQDEVKSKNKLWRNFVREHVTDNEYFLRKRKELNKAGQMVNSWEDPEYYLNERKYVGSKIKAMFEKRFIPILNEIQKDGITKEQLGEFLFYERILKGDRGEVANPGGFQKEFVKEMLGESFTDPEAKLGEGSLRSALGKEKFTKLQEHADNFRKQLKDVFLQGYESGLYNDDVYKLISEADFYVPFRPIKYIDKKTTFGVKKQVGTFEDIENPVITALDKAAAIISQIEYNTSKKISADFIQKNFPEDIQKAETKFNGKVQEFKQPSDKGLGVIFYHDKGKLNAYYVEKELADVINKVTPETSKTIQATIGLMNSTWLKPVFTTMSAGFQIANLFRDFATYYKVSGKSLISALNDYKGAWATAVKKGFDIQDPKILKMYEEGILNNVYYDVFEQSSASPEDFQLEKLKSRYNLSNANSVKAKVNILTPIKKYMDIMEAIGSTFEAIPKIAAYNNLSSFGEKALTMDEKDFIRRFTGSPDFLAGGTRTHSSNALFLFSNAIVQGQRSSLIAMTNPKTRAGYWYKTAWMNVLPKILLFAATMGLFGKEVKDEMDKVSEYNKTNFVLVPIQGRGDKGLFMMKIPQDATGQFIGALSWKVMQLFNKDADKTKAIQDIVAGFGEQFPSVTPAVTVPLDFYKYFTGQNIYDSFKDRNVFTDEQMLIGGVDKAKTFGKYVFSEIGGNTFLRFDYSKEGKDKGVYDAIINLPVFGSVVRRFFVIDNGGVKEKNKAIIKRENVEAAKRNNALENFSEKYMKEFFKGAKQTVDARDNIIDKALDDWEKQNPNVTDEVYDQATKYIKTKLIQLTNKNIDNELFNSLTTYGILNSAKIKLLNEYKKKMPAKDFENILYDLKDFGVISQTVYNSIE